METTTATADTTSARQNYAADEPDGRWARAEAIDVVHKDFGDIQSQFKKLVQQTEDPNCPTRYVQQKDGTIFSYRDGALQSRMRPATSREAADFRKLVVAAANFLNFTERAKRRFKAIRKIKEDTRTTETELATEAAEAELAELPDDEQSWRGADMRDILGLLAMCERDEHYTGESIHDALARMAETPNDEVIAFDRFQGLTGESSSAGANPPIG